MPTPTRRQCPLCEPSPTYEAICPFHAVPTVDLEIFDLPVGSVSAGAVLAGRYKVERALESGGMGTVLIAKQLGVNRTVALKVLRPDRPVDLPLLRRFYNEAHAISSLSHPNIVQVFDFGFDAELRVPYLAMEYVEGSTLDRIIDGGPVAEKRAAKLLSQVARALVEAHSSGIVHRDLKPANIMVSRLRDGEEHVKVLDFGVAKIVRAERDGLTAPGMTLGSPHYMSPEQARAESIDGRADLYSLGCVLYEMLTAKAPFDAEATMDVMSKQVHSPRPPLPERLASDKRPPSEAMRLVYDALLAKRREDRPATATTVAKILTAIAQGTPVDVERLLEDERTERTVLAGSEEKTAATMLAFPPANAVLPVPSATPVPGRGEADRLRILNAATAVPTPEQLGELAKKPVAFAEEVSTDKSVPTLPAHLEEKTPMITKTPAIPEHAPARAGTFAIVLGLIAFAIFGVAIYFWVKGAPVERLPAAPLAAAPRDAAVVAEALPRPSVEPEVVAAPVDAGIVAVEEPARPEKKVGRKTKTAPVLSNSTPAHEVRIVTEPAGAVVSKGGSVLGTTPLSLALNRGEVASLVLKMDGYLERKVTVREDGPSSVKFDLVPVW